MKVVKLLFIFNIYLIYFQTRIKYICIKIEKLKKYFKQYGVVQDAVVMKDPVSKRSRGFGFITFVDINSVDSALADEPHTIDARKVSIKTLLYINDIYHIIINII